jgi:hypothetical protein
MATMSGFGIGFGVGCGVRVGIEFGRRSSRVTLLVFVLMFGSGRKRRDIGRKGIVFVFFRKFGFWRS